MTGKMGEIVRTDSPKQSAAFERLVVATARRDRYLAWLIEVVVNLLQRQEARGKDWTKDGDG